MAVKKSAKKSAAKKAPVTKVAAKKVATKKVSKKAPAKKVAAKKAVAKKASTKKVSKKAPVKKVVTKKVATKKVSKKAPAKKIAAKRTTATKVPQRIIIDADSPSDFNSNRVEIISTTPQPRSIPVVATQEVSDRSGSAQSQKSSSRVVLAVIVGVILIAVFVVARNHNTITPKPSTPSVTPTATPSSTDTSTPSTAPSSPTAISSAPATPAAPAGATDLPPVGIVAHYNSTGATIFWRADTNASGLTTYNVEKSSDGGTFKLIATVPATQLSLDVTETDTNGWNSFKVSAVYADGAVVAGKVFGLPGQYS